eukprot:TRINITY_DN1409_c0_g1_i11.p1 TRINITY_DN1409_c0_g1~~TRINITY_DN1409_c0_g1_i11.p1  ORF type:complete len:809 (+),score=149.41 TRINITY_DN1409_c0_g1_i11:1422-3848(+)
MLSLIITLLRYPAGRFLFATSGVSGEQICSQFIALIAEVELLPVSSGLAAPLWLISAVTTSPEALWINLNEGNIHLLCHHSAASIFSTRLVCASGEEALVNSLHALNSLARTDMGPHAVALALRDTAALNVLLGPAQQHAALANELVLCLLCDPVTGPTVDASTISHFLSQLPGSASDPQLQSISSLIQPALVLAAAASPASAAPNLVKSLSEPLGDPGAGGLVPVQFVLRLIEISVSNDDTLAALGAADLLGALAKLITDFAGLLTTHITTTAAFSRPGACRALLTLLHASLRLFNEICSAFGDDFSAAKDQSIVSALAEADRACIRLPVRQDGLQITSSLLVAQSRSWITAALKPLSSLGEIKIVLKVLLEASLASPLAMLSSLELLAALLPPPLPQPMGEAVRISTDFCDFWNRGVHECQDSARALLSEALLSSSKRVSETATAVCARLSTVGLECAQLVASIFMNHFSSNSEPASAFRLLAALARVAESAGAKAAMLDSPALVSVLVAVISDPQQSAPAHSQAFLTLCRLCDVTLSLQPVQRNSEDIPAREQLQEIVRAIGGCLQRTQSATLHLLALAFFQMLIQHEVGCEAVRAGQLAPGFLAVIGFCEKSLGQSASDPQTHELIVASLSLFFNMKRLGLEEEIREAGHALCEKVRSTPGISHLAATAEEPRSVPPAPASPTEPPPARRSLFVRFDWTSRAICTATQPQQLEALPDPACWRLPITLSAEAVLQFTQQQNPLGSQPTRSSLAPQMPQRVTKYKRELPELPALGFWKRDTLHTRTRRFSANRKISTPIDQFETSD